jgi:hypothetical protein
MKHTAKKVKTYGHFYEFFKRFSIQSLEEIRREICLDDRSDINSLKLRAIDDLCYLKQYSIPL